MERVYPALIAPSGSNYLVYVPDMDIYAEGKSLADAIEMVKDTAGLRGIDFEDDREEMPEASDYQLAIARAKENAEGLGYTKEMLTMVDMNSEEYRGKGDQRMVRRNVILPNWLNIETEKQKLNVSKILWGVLVEKVEQMR